MEPAVRKLEALAFMAALKRVTGEAIDKGFRRGAKFRRLKEGIARLLKANERKDSLRNTRDTSTTFIDASMPSVSLPKLSGLRFEEEDEDELLEAPTLERFISILSAMVDEQTETEQRTGQNDSTHTTEHRVEARPAEKNEHAAEIERPIVDEHIGRQERILLLSKRNVDSYVSESPKANKRLKIAVEEQTGTEIDATATTKLKDVEADTPQTTGVVDVRGNTGGLGDSMGNASWEQCPSTTQTAIDIVPDSPRATDTPSKSQDIIEAQRSPGNATGDYTTAADQTGVSLETLACIKPGFQFATNYAPHSLTNSLTNIDQLTKRVSEITPNSWESQKAQLLEDLQSLKARSIFPWISVDAEVESCNDKKFDAAFDSLQKHISRIPISNLNKYKEQLRHLHSSQRLSGMDVRQRLSQITRIVYLQEELEAVPSLDWERLEEATTICAYISEVTGPVEEEEVAQKVNGWAQARIRDIAWLKKVFAAQERHFGAKELDLET